METDGNFWFELIAFFVLIICSAFFSGSETAMTAASRARMTTLENDGDKRAQLVNKLRERKDRLIGSLLLGNNFVNTLASALAASVMIQIFGEAGIVYATVVVTAMLLIFSEVMPKTYALMHPDKMALLVAPFVSLIVSVFSPVTHAVAKIVDTVFRLFRVDRGADTSEAQEEELRGVIDLLGDEDRDGEEGHAKRFMLRSILDLAGIKVEQIMVHRKDILMINADFPVAKIVDEVLHSAFTRLPVWKDRQDNIIGVIHTKLLLQEMRRCGGDVTKVDLGRIMMDPWFIPESTTLFAQLQAFRSRREHFAIMVDEYGALMGVITLEDILEEIVGQIDDEHDTAVSGVRPQPDGSFIIDGKVTIRDLNREMDWGLPDEDYSTVAGLILFESQRIPQVGQVFTFFDFRLEVLKKQRNQITQVRVTPPADGNENGSDHDRIYEVGA